MTLCLVIFISNNVSLVFKFIAEKPTRFYLWAVTLCRYFPLYIEGSSFKAKESSEEKDMKDRSYIWIAEKDIIDEMADHRSYITNLNRCEIKA